ncbi:MAG: DUF2828 family protein [Clostridia bacterium]|nr:DUF2828 family protein [Clostridia bacterium]
MLTNLKNQMNTTATENGAVTHASTMSDCLDLFATIGALRRESEEEIITRFMRAFTENRDLAVKTLFFARDVRGGLGERKVFRVILRWLSVNAPETVRKNLEFIAEYGRFDDLLVLMDTPLEKAMLALVREQLRRDIYAMNNGGEVSLLAKWLPSVNTSNADAVKTAKNIARFLEMDDRTYRKMLSRLRAHIRIIENNLRERDYTFDYEKQPSKAMLKYRKAFLRNDNERYTDFLSRVQSGDATMHTGTLMPYELITPFFGNGVSDEERAAIDAMWNQLEDFTSGENALAVIDGSGSMYGWGDPKPAAVALSLGLYFAERNRGAFHNHFVTFSERPQMVEVKGADLLEKLQYAASFNEVANTNIQKVFEVVLETAVKHNVPQEELPSTLYIISDMEFDYCTYDASVTNFEYAKRLYAAHGYTLPQVVFWNVASRNRQQPVTKNEQGVALVSGCTPRLFSMVASGHYSPYDQMLEILGNERYAPIAA